MSQNLYGKPASKLTLPEASLIAGPDSRAVGALAVVEPRRRARSQPRGAAADARGRLHHRRAGEGGGAGPAAHPAVSRAPTEARFGYAKEFLRQQFRDRFGGDHPPDWTVRTTFVPELQEAAERAVENGLRRFGNGELQAALVAIDPATGDVLAMVGGRNFRESQFNRAWRSRRQPGSAFKPFLYAAALAKGYSPVSVLEGLTSIAPQGPDEWAPRNAERRRAGSADAARRADRVEQPRRGAAAAAHRVAPGAAPGVGRRPARSARRAVAVARHGARDAARSDRRVSPRFPNGGSAVRAARDHPRDRRRRRRRLRQPGAPGSRHLRSRSPTRWCRCSRTSSTAARRRRRGPPTACGFPSRGKTGTTDDFKDAWFVGFTTSVVVGVWVGEDQPATIGKEGYGARYALPIWSEFIKAAARKRGAREFLPADGMQEVQLCKRLVPEAGRRLPDLQRVLQGRGRHPVAAVPRAPGQREAADPARREGVLGIGKN